MIDGSHKMSCPWHPRLAILCCSLAITGCAVFESNFTNLFTKEPEFRTPHEMIPLWSDTVLHQPARKGQRGCGGRFMFYAGESKEGVRVDGTVTVYVWNDSRSARHRKPDRKYVFPAESLQTHYSKSKVGHSYSFWIPWDEAGNHRTELTVVARFVGTNGTDITTPASNVILPGPIAMPAAHETFQDGGNGRDVASHGIQQTSWTGKQQESSRVRQTLRSSEIQVSPGFVKRNQQVVIEGLSASDLFTPPDDMQESALNDVQSNAGTTENEQPDAGSGSERAGSNLFTGKSSAQRAARSLQSRFQARRERVTQRSASALQTQPTLPTSR